MDIQTAIQVLNSRHGASQLRAFANPEDAVDRLNILEVTQRQMISESAEALSKGRLRPAQLETQGCYPILAIPVNCKVIADHAESFGWTRAGRGMGLFFNTISQSPMMGGYLQEQIGLLTRRYKTEAIVGLSNVPIPLPYVTTKQYGTNVTEYFPQVFTDDIDYCDQFGPGEYPLSLFTGPAMDYAATRFLHYTGTEYQHLQRFVLLTNYDRYMEAFRAYGEAKMGPINFK